jgi:hypothetical protein
MDLRTLVLGVSVFCATFVVGWWLNIAAIFHGTGTFTGTFRGPQAAMTPTTTGQGQQQQTARVIVPVPVPTRSSQGSSTPAAKPVYARDTSPQVSDVKPAPRRFRFRRR